MNVQKTIVRQTGARLLMQSKAFLLLTISADSVDLSADCEVADKEEMFYALFLSHPELGKTVLNAMQDAFTDLGLDAERD